MKFVIAAAGAALTLGLAASAPRPVTAAPSLATLTAHADWLHGRPTAADLRGKVVLVDVFTFGCYNCKNVTPNLKALYASKRANLAIVGIHTPETPYESERANVVTNLAAQGVAWPVAIDDDHALWNAFDIEYWPTQLLFDRHGTLRKTIVGDSQDAALDAEIDRLIAER